MTSIKCGRETYELVDGDTIMDNGHCLQLITRKVTKGWHSYSPTVSKKAFAGFKMNKNVMSHKGEGYLAPVTLWTYLKK